VKFRSDRDVLGDALGLAARAASGRGLGAPATLGVQLTVTGDELVVVGTDRDLTIEVREVVTGSGDGSCVVPGRLVVDIVRSLEPGAVVVESVDDGMVRIAGGRSQFEVRTYAEVEFPRSVPVGSDGVVVSQSDLREALSQVVRAASDDDARPMLNGVLLAASEGGLKVVATDSYRLAVRDLLGNSFLSPGQRLLVPARALAELQRLLGASGDRRAPAGESKDGPAADLRVFVGEYEAVFDLGKVRILTRVLDQEFPPYDPLIPRANPNRLVVNRELMIDAVRRLRLMAREVTSPLRLALQDGAVQLSVVAPEVGQAVEEIEASYEGANFTVAFNPTYLLDGLEAAGAEEVTLEILDITKPVLLRARSDDSYLYVIMPVRIA
jgi:DNA polymerase III subunit beta